MDLDRIRKLAGMSHDSTVAPSLLRENAMNGSPMSDSPMSDELPAAPADMQEPSDPWAEGFDATYEIASDIEEQVSEKGGFNALPEKLLRETKQLLRSLGEINYRATEAPEGQGTDSEDAEEMGTLRRQAVSIMARLKKLKSEKVQESTTKFDYSKKKSSTLVALEEAIEDATECNLTLCEDSAEALLDIEALGLTKVGKVSDLGHLVFTVYEDVDANLWFYTSADSKTIVETTLKMEQLQSFHEGASIKDSNDAAETYGDEANKLTDELTAIKKEIKAAEKAENPDEAAIKKLTDKRDAKIERLKEISTDVANGKKSGDLNESAERKIEVIKARIEKRKKQLVDPDPEYVDDIKAKLAEAERDLEKALKDAKDSKE